VSDDPTPTWYLCPVCLGRHVVRLHYDAPRDCLVCPCCALVIYGEIVYRIMGVHL
jgi:hypothetical protein